MTPKQQAVAYALETLAICIEERLDDDYAIRAAIAELHALSPACTAVRP